MTPSPARFLKNLPFHRALRGSFGALLEIEACRAPDPADGMTGIRFSGAVLHVIWH
jgi:hypothetical protein